MSSSRSSSTRRSRSACAAIRRGCTRAPKQGKIKNFTGIDSPYEAPEHPELRLDTMQVSLAQSAARVVALLRERQILGWGGEGRGDTQTWI